MSFYTANHTVPDLNYEYSIITVDSIGQESNNTFTAHLMTPLNGVVQAKLLATHINTKQTNRHVYVSIEELETAPILNQRTSNVSTGQNGALSNVSGVFATMVTNAIPKGQDDYHHTFLNEYPIVSQYLSPLQNLSTLTVKIYGIDGNTIEPDSDNEINSIILSFITRRRIAP